MQVAPAGLFLRGENLPPYRNGVLVATFSFSANFLKKVIFQRNRVAAAEIYLLAGFFLDNTYLSVFNIGIAYLRLEACE